MKKSLLSLLLMASLPSVAGIKSAAMITTPSGEGQKITQVVLEYDELLHADHLPPASAFTIKDRTVEAVSLGACVEGAVKPCHSHRLILTLGANDPNMLLTYQPAPKSQWVERKPAYAIKQIAPIKVLDSLQAADFREILPNTFNTEKVENRVVDEFIQREFKDTNGTLVKYNLFVPKNYDPQKRYPLVMFIHDAGSTNSNVRHTLLQGNGATTWAAPEFQAQHPAFVLAPQFDHAIVNDNSDDPADLDPTINLIKSLMTEYSIDENRLYATGQSGGAMMSIAMNIKYPTFFAASYLVAGQWAAEKTAPMARNQLMVLVSEDDPKAFPEQNKISEVLALNGAQVQKARLTNGSAEQAQIEQETQTLLDRIGNVYYLTVKSQTLPAQVREPNSSNKGLAHSGTWKIAYDIEAIKQWLFAQRKAQ